MIQSTRNIFEKSEELILKRPGKKSYQKKHLDLPKYQNKYLNLQLCKLISFFYNIPILSGRFFINPFRMLRIGSAAFFKPLNLFVYVSLVLMIVYFFSPDSSDLHPYTKQAFQSLIIIIPLFIILFSSPSTYILNHLKDSHIFEIKKFIVEEKIKTVAEIELLEDSIDILFVRSENRFVFYRWIIVSCSSIFFILQGIQLRLMHVDKNVLPQTVFDNVMVPLGIVTTMILAATIMLSVYKRATVIIFDTIKCACISQKRVLLNNKKHTLVLPKRS